MQMHDVNVFFFDQSEKRPERARIEFSLIEHPYRNWARRKYFPNRASGSKHARNNAKPFRVEARNNIPVETTASVEASVITDVIDHPQHVDSRHKIQFR
jgi:hypothetical protein